MNSLTIILPHTPRELSPNASTPLTVRGAIVANRKKITAKKTARNNARIMMLSALKGEKITPEYYTVRWIYKGVRPDDDNVLARCKYYKDGACAAMGIDDGDIRCKGIFLDHDLKLAGTVIIKFYEL